MVKRNLKNLRLRAIAAVDRPCQEHAKALVIKRAFTAEERQHLAESGAALPDGSYPIENASDLDNAIHAIGRASSPGKAKAHIITRARALGALDKLPEEWNVKKFEAACEIVKYIGDGDEGAQSFQDVLAETNFNQNVWPCVDALSQSIRSIVGDSSLTGGERDAKISDSVNGFLQAVRDISPQVSKQLEPLLVKGDGQMPKSIEELEKQVGELTGQLTSANALVASEKARADAAEKAKTDAVAEKDKADEACATAKAALVAATDETIKYGGEEIKKSEAGEGPFKAMKAMQAGEQSARLEKRVAEEFPHVVGTSAEKALVLKTIDGLPEDDATRKSLESILKSAESMAKAGFDRLGSGGGIEPTVKAARATFDEKVAEIEKRDSCPRSQAMSKARGEFPTEFAAAYPEQAAPAN